MIKEATIKKWFIIFGFSCFAISLVAFLIESSPLYDIHGLDVTNIKSMKIYDRGLLGNDKVEIKDVETIQKIGNLINSSTNISDADANLKINRGLCMLDIVFRDDKITEINVVTTVTGGIITSGQFCYRSDSLLSIIIQELNNNSPKK